MNDSCITMIPITTMVSITIMVIHPDCHDRERGKIGGRESVIIGRNIGHVHR